MAFVTLYSGLRRCLNFAFGDLVTATFVLRTVEALSLKQWEDHKRSGNMYHCQPKNGTLSLICRNGSRNLIKVGTLLKRKMVSLI